MPVRHVLLDADGVMQDLRSGWEVTFASLFGDRAEEFVARIAMDEQPSLRGEVPFTPVLAAALEEFGLEEDVRTVYARWLDIVVDERSRALVHDLRRRGLGVHLATNQNPERRDHMRDVLEYDDLFDSSFYSCELGVAKPDAAYFSTVLDRLGVPAGEVLFVDDSVANVDGARGVGLLAEHWHLDQGHDRLDHLMARHLG